MGLRPDRAHGSVRFSLSSYNTDEDVDYLLEHLPGIISKLRGDEGKPRKASRKAAAAV